MKTYFKILIIGILYFSNSINSYAQGNLPAPEDISAENYQREIELKWKKTDVEQLQWEVLVDDKAPVITEQNSFIVTGLEPNTAYTVKLRAKQGDKYSPYVTIPNTHTKPMERSIDDIQRIPYVRTLATRQYEYGYIPRKMPIFYNELAVKDAKITYAVDDEKVTLDGYYLNFPKTGRQKLTITIEETPDRVWELIYKVNVWE